MGRYRNLSFVFLSLWWLVACTIPAFEQPNPRSDSASARAGGGAVEPALTIKAALDPRVIKLGLRPVAFSSLPQWPDVDFDELWPVWQRNCAALGKMKADRDLGAGYRPKDFLDACRRAGVLQDRGAIRSYFEANFMAFSYDVPGKFTGYFEPVYAASKTKTSEFSYPIYRLPTRPNLTRAQITQGAIMGHELYYLASPVDVFVLHVQGSGQLRLQDGGIVRVGYAGNNGATYVAIGRPMIEAGLIAKEKISLQSITHWLKTHPAEADKWIARNPRYIYYCEIQSVGDGPLGAMGVPLTAGRSLAVDRGFVPLGAPLWLDTTFPVTKKALNRMVVAQDTGGAIKGKGRGDFFWGSGDEAAKFAGPMNEQGTYYLLLPVP